MMERKYRNETRTISQDKRELSACNMITFINKGTASVTIDGYPLATDEKIEYSGFPGELDTTTYDIVFSSVGTKNLKVIRKVYQPQK